jgi:transposase InsO family protein
VAFVIDVFARRIVGWRVPLDPELLDTPAYKKFLEVRRARIANRLNMFVAG